MKKREPTPAQHELADYLLSLAPGCLVKHTGDIPEIPKEYITLDQGTGRNKNAVSILHTRASTSFMAPDWTLETQVQALGLQSERVENAKVGKRLNFPGLSKKTIEEHRAHSFFKEALSVAKSEAINRQSGRKRQRSVQSNDGNILVGPAAGGLN